jgi:hypothetical protein
MNTLVLLVAASCTPAADPLPVMETAPYTVPNSIRAATQEWSDGPQENRPRFFARIRARFGRRSRAAEGPSPGLSGYSQGITGNSTISPSPIASPGTSMAEHQLSDLPFATLRHSAEQPDIAANACWPTVLREHRTERAGVLLRSFPSGHSHFPLSKRTELLSGGR